MKMTLYLNCPTDEFAKFKSGIYKSIVVEGTRKIWEGGPDIHLGDLVTVTNCNSKEILSFKVSEFTRYTGAHTLESALNDLRGRFGLNGDSHANIPFYQAQHDKPGLMPFLYEGIYAIMIKRYRTRAGRGGKN